MLSCHLSYVYHIQYQIYNNKILEIFLKTTRCSGWNLSCNFAGLWCGVADPLCLMYLTIFSAILSCLCLLVVVLQLKQFRQFCVFLSCVLWSCLVLSCLISFSLCLSCLGLTWVLVVLCYALCYLVLCRLASLPRLTLPPFFPISTCLLVQRVLQLLHSMWNCFFFAICKYI